MSFFKQIEHASLTDVGVRRSNNQDNLATQLAADEDLWRQRGHLYLVADGMGAHAVGEKASEQATRVIPHIYAKYAVHGAVNGLRKAFIEANASIHAFGQQNREFEGTGTTATALVLRPEGAWVGHVGDSRAYRIRGGQIEQLSYDHSLVWEYARLKKMDPEQVRDLLPSNVIHRCLGPEPLVQVDIEGPYPLEAGDIFLLCSDGLSGQVNDAEIGAVVSVLPPAEACRFLVDLANARGGPDNITVIVVKVGGDPRANGVYTAAVGADAPALGQKTRQLLRWSWWLVALFCTPILVIMAVTLVSMRQESLGTLVFILAAGSVIAGLIGFGRQYLTERNEPPADDGTVAPRVHRQASCKIDQPMFDKLQAAVAAVRQQAEEKHWPVDATGYAEHRARAAELSQGEDLAAAYREECLALMEVTRNMVKAK